jgi:hypothetical protein
VGSIFEKARVPKELGILSIDIDGNDYWVWRALDAYRPAVVVIEYNSALPFDEAVTQPYDSADPELTNFSGASLGALERLAQAEGCRLPPTGPSCALAGDCWRAGGEVAGRRRNGPLSGGAAPPRSSA